VLETSHVSQSLDPIHVFASKQRCILQGECKRPLSKVTTTDGKSSHLQNLMSLHHLGGIYGRVLCRLEIDHTNMGMEMVDFF
jgi:hypothetical protein